MKHKNRKKIKSYFVYTSIMPYLYFLIFSEMKYTSSILLSLKRNNWFTKSTSNICTFAHKFINLESLLQVYIYTSEFQNNTSISSLLQVYFKVWR